MPAYDSLVFKGVNERHEEWRERAQCKLEGIPTSSYYPEQYQSLDLTYEALKACVERCKVREECLQYALDNRERHGYFGSVSERNRRRLVRLGTTAVEYFAGNPEIQITRRGRPPKKVV